MPLSIALIGCGWLATGFHGPALVAYASRHRDTRLVACCDTDATKAESFGRRFRFERAFTDLDQLLAEARPDAAILVVPDAVTCPVACRLFEARVPVLLEKPPGRTVGEIDRMIAAAERAGVHVEVAFNRRHMPLIEKARSLLAEFPAGDIFHIDYEMTRFNRRDPDFSLTAIHGIDLVSHIAGGPYRDLAMRYQPLEAMGAGVTNIYMQGTLGSGVFVSLRFVPVAGTLTERLVLHGKDRSLYAYLPVGGGLDGQGHLTCVRAKEVVFDSRSAATVALEPWETGGFYAEDEHFLEHIRGCSTVANHLQASRQTVAVMEAIRHRAAVFPH